MMNTKIAEEPAERVVEKHDPSFPVIGDNRDSGILEELAELSAALRVAPPRAFATVVLGALKDIQLNLRSRSRPSGRPGRPLPTLRTDRASRFHPFSSICRVP